MIPDLDIYRTAKLLVEKHGDMAPNHAAMQADAMLEKGDMGGKAAWLRILRAVRDLLHARPSGGNPIH